MPRAGAPEIRRFYGRDLDPLVDKVLNFSYAGVEKFDVDDPDVRAAYEDYMINVAWANEVNPYGADENGVPYPPESFWPGFWEHIEDAGPVYIYRQQDDQENPGSLSYSGLMQLGNDTIYDVEVSS